MQPDKFRAQCEALYAKYNHREFIGSDPLQFVWRYDQARDREVVGLIASSLAFGGVSQIAKCVEAVLQRMPGPCAWIGRASPSSLARTFRRFRYRFVDCDDLCDLLRGIRRVIDRYGSLRDCFASGLHDADATVLPAVNGFVAELRAGSTQDTNYLLPRPSPASACKRLHLYLRWMIRRDEIDPGVWAPMPTGKLIVPVDTHMHRTALRWGLTTRRQADQRTAIEITEAFRRIAPHDPVRYDFALTRLSMRGNL